MKTQIGLNVFVIASLSLSYHLNNAFFVNILPVTLWRTEGIV